MSGASAVWAVVSCGGVAGAAADAVLAESVAGAADAALAESAVWAGVESRDARWVGADELSRVGRADAGFLVGGEAGRVAAFAGGGVSEGATAVGRLAVSLAAGAAGVV